MNDLQRKDSSMKEQWNESTATAKGLYDPSFEHDNCGIGAVVNIKGIKTHQTVENALKIVENLKHRAGKDADGKTGDGVGILLQISHKFFKKAVEPLGIKLGEERDYGVGMFFFPQDELKTNQAKKMFEVIVEKEGMEFSDGDRYRFIRTSFPTRPEDVCHASCRRSSKDRKMWRRDLILTASCMWHAVYSSSPTMTATLLPFRAERLYIKECSL